MSCPPEPPQNRSLAVLRPDFKARLIQWMGEVNRILLPGTVIKPSETHRTQQRQQWLYRQGRERGCGVPGRPVTWTLDSNHKYYIAADLFLDKRGEALWDSELYMEVYSKVPPENYGLETLAPREYAHIQIQNANNSRTDWTPQTPAPPPPPAVTNKPVRIFSPSNILLGSGTFISPDKVYLKNLDLNFKEMEQK